MVTILPLKDKERLAQILHSVPHAANSAAVLVMSDGAEELGYVVTDIQASVLRMLTMKITGCDNFYNLTPDIRICADSMMRAAASYGANNGAYKIESHITELNPFYASIGFTIENNIAYCDLKNIIKIRKN